MSTSTQDAKLPISIFHTPDIDRALDWISRKKKQYDVVYCDIVPFTCDDGTTKFQAEVSTGGR